MPRTKAFAKMIDIVDVGRSQWHQLHDRAQARLQEGKPQTQLQAKPVVAKARPPERVVSGDAGRMELTASIRELVVAKAISELAATGYGLGFEGDLEQLVGEVVAQALPAVVSATWTTIEAQMKRELAKSKPLTPGTHQHWHLYKSEIVASLITRLGLKVKSNSLEVSYDGRRIATVSLA
jgi:hypothetical protein